MKSDVDVANITQISTSSDRDTLIEELLSLRKVVDDLNEQHEQDRKSILILQSQIDNVRDAKCSDSLEASVQNAIAIASALWRQVPPLPLVQIRQYLKRPKKKQSKSSFNTSVASSRPESVRPASKAQPLASKQPTGAFQVSFSAGSESLLLPLVHPFTTSTDAVRPIVNPVSVKVNKLVKKRSDDRLKEKLRKDKSTRPYMVAVAITRLPGSLAQSSLEAPTPAAPTPGSPEESAVSSDLLVLSGTRRRAVSTAQASVRQNSNRLNSIKSV